MVVWQPGMRCVCVSEKFKSTCGSTLVARLPRKGVVYTVRALHPLGHLWLAEIVNVPQLWSTGFHEFAFHPARFRPLPENRLDTLRALLAPTPRVTEPA